ncbi:hypothetical protein MRB53_040611 [Persea americana]|nr:hypothetical protein MRB53_040611 [Persea americana]
MSSRVGTAAAADATAQAPPSLLRYTLGFVLVGVAWGFTTPFIRRAALNHKTRARPSLEPATSNSLKRLLLSAYYAMLDLLVRPAYAVPLLINVTGSVWFFLLIGEAELSLTVPITNSLAFLFTVLGEWCAEGKVIGRGESLHTPRADTLAGIRSSRSHRYLLGHGSRLGRYSALRARKVMTVLRGGRQLETI